MKTREQLLDDIEQAMIFTLKFGFCDPKPIVRIIEDIRVQRRSSAPNEPVQKYPFGTTAG